MVSRFAADRSRAPDRGRRWVVPVSASLQAAPMQQARPGLPGPPFGGIGRPRSGHAMCRDSPAHVSDAKRPEFSMEVL